jgi:hypothetical protein
MVAHSPHLLEAERRTQPVQGLPDVRMPHLRSQHSPTRPSYCAITPAYRFIQET